MAFTMALPSSISLDISLQVMSTIFSGVLSLIEHCALVSDYTFNGIGRALCSLSPFWLPIEHCALVLGRVLHRIEHCALPFGVTSHPWSSIMLPCVVYCRRSTLVLWFVASLGLDRGWLSSSRPVTPDRAKTSCLKVRLVTW
jgi:hypothetical protein